MSNVYISEPPTNGKVILNTTGGDIAIELWSKEAPLACKNFVQLCLEGYYDETYFLRLVRNFIFQGGDPTCTGEGGESIYDEPFKIETHSRLRFNRRGLVAMHCVDNKVHGSQFFFTLDKTPELQNNYTIFGSVAGDTLFNMLSMAAGFIDSETLVPINPKQIISTEVINNPFKDIVPRVNLIIHKFEDTDESSEEERVDRIKDTGLLSFGGDDEDLDSTLPVKKKSKSAHDYSIHSNLSTTSYQVDPNEEKCVVNNMALVPIDEPKYIDQDEVERAEKIKTLRKEADSFQTEMAQNILKKQNADDKPEEEIVVPETNAQRESKVLQKLDDFNKRIGTPLETDFFKYDPDEEEESYNNVIGIPFEPEMKFVDPALYNPDKYDLHDPRNPLNIRKRNAEVTGNGSSNKKPK